MKQPSWYGVPSGPVMRALMQSTRDSSTLLGSASFRDRTTCSVQPEKLAHLRKMDEFHATGRLVVRTASSLAMARDRFGTF